MKIKVNLQKPADESYEIIINEKVFPYNIPASLLSGPSCIVTNKKIYKLHYKKIASSFKKSKVFFLPDGEKYKNLSSVQKIYSFLIKNNFGRNSALIAFGGGVIGDITGFAAATFMRGIKFIQVPTTLLSQVDSSVGGKTGVNLTGGKNLCGAFYQPELVLIETGFLKTLSKKEFLCGMGEVIKYGVMMDSALFDLLLKSGDIRKDKQNLKETIIKCVDIKRKVVEEDEKEKGLRKILNLGHTLGHGIEKYFDYKIKHGDAIAAGIVFASFIGTKNGLPQKDFKDIKTLLKKYSLSFNFSKIKNTAKLFKAVKNDKKSLHNKKIDFIIPVKKSKVEIKTLSFEKIEKYYKEFVKGRHYVL